MQAVKNVSCPACNAPIWFRPLHSVYICDACDDTDIVDYEENGRQIYAGLVWVVFHGWCPACLQNALILASCFPDHSGGDNFEVAKILQVFRPLRRKIQMPGSVPQAVANDYINAQEAARHSALASAILSRRCLERIFREANANGKQEMLGGLIHKIESKKQVPEEFLKAFKEINNIGCHAAHADHSGDASENDANRALEIIEILLQAIYVIPMGLQDKLICKSKGS